MPKEVKQYPEGTYGAWLQQKNEQLTQRIRDIQERANDLTWRAEHQNDKVPEGQPAYYNTDLQMGLWQVDAATVYARMSAVQKRMLDSNKWLYDKLPPEADMDELTIEAGQQASKKEFMELFHADMINKTADFFGVTWKMPPTPDYTVNRFGELRGAREQEMRERRASAKVLVDQLKKSAQKSFTGKLKSFFVGNSKEYKEALQAMQNFADGKGNPAEARDKISKYLDLRGNKVRDHQYGRERFDAMLSGLALVTSKEEFEKRCGAIDEARSERSKGTYKGTIDPEKYSPEAQKQAREATREAAERSRETAQQERSRTQEEPRRQQGGMSREM